MNKSVTGRPILKRFPPGDRWVPFNTEDEESIEPYETLTDALEYAHKATNGKKFIVDAASGIVYVIEEEKDQPVVQEKKYSIYGE